MGFKIDVPVFSEEIKKLEGKEVTVKGYIIPVEGYKSHKEFTYIGYNHPRRDLAGSTLWTS